VDGANRWCSTTSTVDESAWGDDNPSHWGADKTLIGQRDRLTILIRHSGTPVADEAGRGGVRMRELEASLQQFGEFLLKARLVKEKAAPYCVRWVRRFLTRGASDEPVADQVRRFCEDLEREGRWEEWQVRQAEHALRIYFVNFLKRTDWQRTPASAIVDERGHTSPLAALEQLRQRVRTRHYSYRTECSYADWVRRFCAYLAERQGVPHPRVISEDVRDYATHLAVHQRVSASTQNQALSAVLFLCREVLGVEVEGVALATRAKRGIHLPVVLSMPETAALLGAMRGTTWLMAALIYGGGLRVSECCQLRIKDVDFDQGLIFVRGGKGAKDRSTLLAEMGRDELRAHLRQVDARYQADRASGLAGVCRTRWSASTPTRVANSDGSGSFRVTRCRLILAPASCVDITSATQ
jgi:integrase